MSTTDSIHRQTWDVIPWIVNRSASAEDQESARIHLESCPDCREELALQEKIHAGLNSAIAVDESRARQSLGSLLNQIDANDGQYFATGTLAPSRPAHEIRNRHRWLAGLAAAVIVQAIGLIALGTMVVEARNSAGLAGSYATLSSQAKAAPEATIRLVPSPTMSVGHLQTLLDASGLQIVGSNSGATILALAPVSVSGKGGKELTPQEQERFTIESIARLREGPGILLAEPINAPLRTP